MLRKLNADHKRAIWGSAPTTTMHTWVEGSFELIAEGQMDARRLESLTDNVFAVAMTLLVFDLKVPRSTTHVSMSLCSSSDSNR